MQTLPKFLVAVSALLITALLATSIFIAVDANKKGYEAATEQINGLDIREVEPDRTVDEQGNTIADPYQ